MATPAHITTSVTPSAAVRKILDSVQWHDTNDQYLVATLTCMILCCTILCLYLYIYLSMVRTSFLVRPADVPILNDIISNMQT